MQLANVFRIFRDMASCCALHPISRYIVDTGCSLVLWILHSCIYICHLYSFIPSFHSLCLPRLARVRPYAARALNLAFETPDEASIIEAWHPYIQSHWSRATRIDHIFDLKYLVSGNIRSPFPPGPFEQDPTYNNKHDFYHFNILCSRR